MRHFLNRGKMVDLQNSIVTSTHRNSIRCYLRLTHKDSIRTDKVETPGNPDSRTKSKSGSCQPRRDSRTRVKRSRNRSSISSSPASFVRFRSFWLFYVFFPRVGITNHRRHFWHYLTRSSSCEGWWRTTNHRSKSPPNRSKSRWNQNNNRALKTVFLFFPKTENRGVCPAC